MNPFLKFIFSASDSMIYGVFYFIKKVQELKALLKLTKTVPTVC